MPRWLMGLLLLWVPLIVGGGLWYMSDGQKAKRAFDAINSKLNAATESRNIPALTQFLKDTLDENAKVSLSVQHTMVGFKSNAVLMSQEFSKPEFIRFMELTLEPMESYALKTRIEAITKNPDGTYAVATYGVGNGSAQEYMRGTRIPTSYSVQTRCAMRGRHDDSVTAITQMKCDVGLGQSVNPVNAADTREIMNRAIGVTP